MLNVTELSEKERLPQKFLHTILADLKEAGYIETKRGKQGGYALAKPSAQIVLGSVIRTIEGPLAPIRCVSQMDYQRCSCPDEEHCGLRMLMLDVRNAIARILDRYTLGDVVEITVRKMKRDGFPIPFLIDSTVASKTPSLHNELPEFAEGGFLAELFKR